ncbi:MAG: DUF5615 family PIN-like protein [Cyclobacteriaceae bacterium]
MKLLLDENLPTRLKHRFSTNLEISTVRDQKWTGIKNGHLLKLMRENNFKALVTIDKNLRYQQNLDKNDIIIVVIMASTNRYQVVKEYVPLIEKEIPFEIEHGVIEIHYPK